MVEGRLHLFETNAVNQTYYPGRYTRDCSFCGFHTDTNSHALTGCRRLHGLYIERRDRYVELILQELSKSVLAELCEVMQNQYVFLGRQC